MRAPVDEPTARRALDVARAAGSEAEHHRVRLLDAAARRQRAMLAAQQAGMSVRAIARELGCSASVVQQALGTARCRRAAGD